MPAFCFRMDENHFEPRGFRKRSNHDYHLVSLSELNPESSVIALVKSRFVLRRSFCQLLTFCTTNSVITRVSYSKGLDKREMFGHQTPSNIV